MIDVFDIEGKFYNNDIVMSTLSIKDMKLYANIPSWIEERNVYDINTKKQIAVIKPKKFGGLSYTIYNIIDEYAEIKTLNYGFCLVKLTEAITISNEHFYESGCY